MKTVTEKDETGEVRHVLYPSVAPLAGVILTKITPQRKGDAEE